MPKATDEQRAAFADALREAMRKRAETLSPTLRTDDWLGEQIGMSGQAIRNYTSKLREPKNARVVEDIEDALRVPRHHLGKHLGYGPSMEDRVRAIETQVEDMKTTLHAIEQQLQRVVGLLPERPQGRSRSARDA